MLDIPFVYLSYLDIVNATIPIINVSETQPDNVPQPFLYVPVDKTKLFGLLNGFEYVKDASGIPVARDASGHSNIDKTHLSNCITAALTNWGPDPFTDSTYTIPFAYGNNNDTFEVDAEQANASIGLSSLGDHIMLIFASIYNSSIQVDSVSSVFKDLTQVTLGVSTLNQNITDSLVTQLETQDWQDKVFQSFVNNNGLRPLLDDNAGNISITSNEKDMALVFIIRGLKLTVNYGAGTSYDITLLDVPLYLHMTDDPLATMVP